MSMSQPQEEVASERLIAPERTAHTSASSPYLCALGNGPVKTRSPSSSPRDARGPTFPAEVESPSPSQMFPHHSSFLVLGTSLSARGPPSPLHSRLHRADAGHVGTGFPSLLRVLDSHWPPAFGCEACMSGERSQFAVLSACAII